MWCFYIGGQDADFDETTTIQMFYSQTLNFFILLEKVAVVVCTCLVSGWITDKSTFRATFILYYFRSTNISFMTLFSLLPPSSGISINEWAASWVWKRPTTRTLWPLSVAWTGTWLSPLNNSTLINCLRSIPLFTYCLLSKVFPDHLFNPLWPTQQREELLNPWVWSPLSLAGGYPQVAGGLQWQLHHMCYLDS